MMVIYTKFKLEGGNAMERQYIVRNGVKDGEIIKSDENVNVIIECEGISKELKEIFKDQDFLIVKYMCK